MSWLIDEAYGEHRSVLALTQRMLTVNFVAIHTSSMVPAPSSRLDVRFSDAYVNVELYTGIVRASLPSRIRSASSRGDRTSHRIRRLVEGGHAENEETRQLHERISETQRYRSECVTSFTLLSSVSRKLIDPLT